MIKRDGGARLTPLRRLVLFSVIGSALVAAIVTTVYIFLTTPSSIRRETEEHVAAVAEPLAQVLAEQWTEKDASSIRRLVEQAGANPTVNRVVVFDTTAARVVDTAPDNRLDTGVRSYVTERLASPNMFGQMITSRDGTFIYVEPIPRELFATRGQSVLAGMLAVWPDVNHSRRSYVSAVVGVLVIFMLALAGSHILVFLAIDRLALRPLRRVIAAVRANDVEAIGETARRTAVVEIHRLVASFVALIYEIQAKNQHLQDNAAHLENLVQERTAALRARERAMINQEKLASLGRLSAGVAHEINNPTGYVYSNLETLDEYVRLFKSTQPLAEAALRAFNEGNPDLGRKKYRELMEVHEKEDLSFVRRDVLDLVAASKKGMQRIADIVHGLRTFAGDDRAENEEVDLAAAMSEALQIAHNALKYEYSVDVTILEHPIISSNRSRLVQAFLNLLINAKDATPRGGEIRVEVYGEGGNTCVVAVSDTGEGMDHDVQKHIFDPFFTTKPVGSGTGLGLSLVHSVVEESQGWVKVDSNPGEGARFELRFPASFELEADEPDKRNDSHVRASDR